MSTIAKSVFLMLSLMTISAFAGHQCDSACAMPKVNVIKKHFITGGVQYADVSGLNRTLTAYGLPGFHYYGPSFGFESQTIMNRLMMGGELKGFFVKDISSGNTKASFSAGQLLMTSGVELIKSEHLNLYPYLGLGAGLMRVSVGATNTPFDTAIVKSLPAVDVFQAKFLIDLGLGFDLIANGEKGKGATLGIRTGYMFDPVKNDKWWRTGSDFSNGPAPMLSGPYITLTMGVSKPASMIKKPSGKRMEICPMKDKMHESGN
jgi:hypothetical protein